MNLFELDKTCISQHFNHHYKTYMDRYWINSICISVEYKRGLEEFIQFGQRNASSGDEVKFIKDHLGYNLCNVMCF